MAEIRPASAPQQPHFPEYFIPRSPNVYDSNPYQIQNENP